MNPTMEASALQLPIHKHPLYPLTRYLHALCEGCCVKGHIYGGYRCNESECYNNGNGGVWFHKECAESPSEINHPFHSEHPLFFTEKIDHNPCDLCGRSITSGYCCATCNFFIDMPCALKPLPPLAIENPMFHDHPLVRSKIKPLAKSCKLCKNHVTDGCPYECLGCQELFHLECVNQSRQVNHSFHSNHLLEYVTSESLPEDAENTCILCGKESQKVLDHCSRCNFSICLHCARNPPPLTIEHPKTHKHKLSLLSVRVSFTCKVCGMQGDRSPYSCIKCSFLVHRDCIDLPRVININRHNHRISLTDHLGLVHGDLKCGVCHQSVNRYYGGYTCSICPSFVVHSRCPTKYRVWDGIELEGVPEEDAEELAPFKVVGDGLIQHFGHEKHILRLYNNGVVGDEKIRCEACTSPVYSDPIYNCEQCTFILHETCANLPRRKRLAFHNIPFTLYTSDMDSNRAFECFVCKTMSTGFRYVADSFSLDVRCGTFSESVFYDFHIHPLYYRDDRMLNKCGACQDRGMFKPMLSCDDCDFEVDFRCSNLPKVVKHKYDEHPLTLCYGDDPIGKYWCDICEGETNPKDWFYTCSHCGVTLHVRCVLGEFSFLMPRRVIEYMGCIFEVVPNIHFSRPFCARCQARCIGPFILKILYPETMYICSEICLLAPQMDPSRFLVQKQITSRALLGHAFDNV